MGMSCRSSVNAVKAAGGLLQFAKATNLAKAAGRVQSAANMGTQSARSSAISALVVGLIYFTQTETGPQGREAITEAFYSP